MFKKKDQCKSVAEVVERNTKIPMEEFLHPVEEPYIHNLKEAAAFILNHLDLPMHLIGDYDSDGVNATGILYHGLSYIGVEASTRIPRRFTEGYGLSEKIVDEITFSETLDEIQSGLVITVDNGIAAAKAIQKAKDRGLYVIVTDHHLPPRDEEGNVILPPADIIVDPSAEDFSEFHHYCGAAIAYRLAKELNDGAKLNQLLVLAGIATVTDVMPLIGANRYLVSESLRLINKNTVVPGLKMMLEKLNLVGITEEDYGFKIGPIFNASGRLFDDGASKITEILKASEITPEMTFQIDKVIATNDHRKRLVKEAMEVVDLIYAGERPIVIYDSSFGEGIVGIIAGRLAEKYQCPAIVFTMTDKGIMKGSGRSVPGIHLKEILDKIQGQMLGYGGHAGAAGLSIKPENFQSFRKAFIQAVGDLPPIDEDFYYDLELEPENLKATVEELKKYAPYGEGNRKPIFRMKCELPEKDYKRIGDGSHFMTKNGEFAMMGFGLTEKYEAFGRPQMIDSVGTPMESSYKARNGSVRTSFKWVMDDLEMVETDQGQIFQSLPLG